MATEKYLKEIAENTSVKPSFQVVLTGVGSRLTSRFNPPIVGGCKYEIALTALETYYSFPNVDNSNNKLKVTIKGNFVDITIPLGCYEILAINKELKKQIVDKGGKEDDVTLSPNLNTFHSHMKLEHNTQVDFNVENSLCSILGFERKIYKDKNNESEKRVDIMRVNNILVHNSLIGSSYINDYQFPVIYAFFPSALPGERIEMRPTTLIYLPVALDIIPQMTSWLTDQNSRAIDLQGERLTLTFHIRSC